MVTLNTHASNIARLLKKSAIVVVKGMAILVIGGYIGLIGAALYFELLKIKLLFWLF